MDQYEPAKVVNDPLSLLDKKVNKEEFKNTNTGNNRYQRYKVQEK